MQTTNTHATGTALVMHEDLWVRSHVAATLGRVGFTVLAASNGASGMRLVEQHQPEVIVLGMALPEISGAAVLEHLHRGATTKDIPVLVVSSLTADGVGAASPDVGKSPQRVSLSNLLPELEQALQPTPPSALVPEPSF